MEETVPTRFFWSRGRDCPWWKPIVLGEDENCNRTIGLKLPGGVLFLCPNIPLRQGPCLDCEWEWS